MAGHVDLAVGRPLRKSLFLLSTETSLPFTKFDNSGNLSGNLPIEKNEDTLCVCTYLSAHAGYILNDNGSTGR